MHRRDVLLAVLAQGGSKPFRPVHVQKILFVLDRKRPELFDENAGYRFVKYDYGPFDSSIYHDLEALEHSGDVEIDRESGYRYRVYNATLQGAEKGRAFLSQMPAEDREFLKKTVDLLLPLSFGQLVKAIYRAYPDWKENSVFKH